MYLALKYPSINYSVFNSSNNGQELFQLAKEILIVSTDEFSSKRLIQHIDSCYHNCMGVVRNFIRAERQIDSKKPDLILISMDLAGEFDGFETAKVLKLEYDIPLVLYGQRKHQQMEYWNKEIQPAGALYLEDSDRNLKQHIQKLLS